MGTAEELKRAYKILLDVTESSFIPFASPSPSSTEKKIKDSIIEAMRLIDKARYLSIHTYGNEPIANVC